MVPLLFLPYQPLHLPMNTRLVHTLTLFPHLAPYMHVLSLSAVAKHHSLAISTLTEDRGKDKRVFTTRYTVTTTHSQITLLSHTHTLTAPTSHAISTS